MVDVVKVVATATGAFAGTNIDDFVVLLLLIIGMPLDGIRRWQIISGQYIGFSALLILSGIGALVLHRFSDGSVGLLGIIPLALGARAFFRIRRSGPSTENAPILVGSAFNVAIVTLANGGDNVSVYVLLFRQLDVRDVVITILVFLFLLGGLCAAALIIGQNARVVPKIIRGNKWLTPIVFTVIGLIVLVRTGAVLKVFDTISGI